MNFESVKESGLLNIFKTNEIAKYIRLSLADEDKKDESESVANQRRLINDFICKNGNNGEECKEFVDDGVSGTNFDRPAWKDLMTEVDKGNIKVIITKSLSRLGRSNFECSYYLDYYFPENKIRYIALQEQIDTGNESNTNNEYAALNNFINEKYSRDLSKNIKRVYKMKQTAGEYMGGIPIYGYRKDPNDKHKLLIDENAAKIVRRIFELYLQTESQNKVRTILSNEKVPVPEVYKGTRRGLKCKNPYEWNYSTIRDILKNEMYIGNMVQNIFSKKSFRDKKLIKNKKEEWIVVAGTHEPIIEKEIYNQVQNLLRTKYKKSVNSYPHVFAGLLVCKECRHKIGIGNVKRDREKIYQYFYTYCNSYRKNGVYDKCSPHSLNYNNLEEQLLKVLDGICSKFIKMIKYEEIINEKKKGLTTYSDTIITKINALEIDEKEINLKIERLYNDRLDGIVTIDMYKKIAHNLEEKKADIIKEKETLQSNYEEYNKNNGVKKLLETEVIVKEYLKAKRKTDRSLVMKLVDKIEIHQDKTIDLYLKLKPLDLVN